MAGDLTYRGKSSPKADPTLFPGNQLSSPQQSFNKVPPPRTGQFYNRPAYTDPQATQFGSSEQDDQQLAKPPKHHSVLRSVLKFAAVQLGLAFLVIGYTVAGGFIFQELEQANEKDLCTRTREQYLSQVENVTLDQLWAISRAFRDETDPIKLTAGENQVLQVVSTFGANSYNLGYTGNDCDTLGSADNPYAWNLAGAILFASTVVTTVGYGNMYPKTNWGRIVCIAYAILGIPLMLLWLANLGGVMADVFRFIYANVCCCRACRKKKPAPGSSKVSPSSSVGHSRTDLVGHAEGMGQSEAPGATGTDSSIEAWKAGFTAQQQLPQHGNNARVIEDDDPPMGDEDEEDEEERVTVPLTITLSILGAYVFMGALLFGVWEGWSALTSAYFCFITIATIGFGDVVPGAAGKANAAAQMEMFGCAIYMVVGMAIVSMCFNLIQEEIVGKFQWIAEKFGIADKNKEEELQQQEAIEGAKKPEEAANHLQYPAAHQHNDSSYHPNAANPNAAAPRSHVFNDNQPTSRPGSSGSNDSKRDLIRY